MSNRTFAFAALLTLAPAFVFAQQAGVVTGIVRDSGTTRPLFGTLVTLVGVGYRESVQSEETGVFWFTRAKPGRYTVSARRLGYAPFSTTIDVVEQTDSVNISLTRIATLDTVRVRPGAGIYGVIGTAREVRPLRGVEIQIVGSGTKVRTDSSGRFFVPLDRQGAYVVRTRVAGYAPQTASVTVHKDAVTEVMLLLEESSAGRSTRTEVAWREFGDRVRLRGSSSALVSRAELLQNGDVGLIEAIQRASSVTGKNLRFGSTVCVFLDGFPSPTTPVGVFNVEAIEAVEVYTVDPRSDETRTLSRQSRGYECHLTGFPPTATIQRDLIKWVVIWLKK